MTMNPLLPVALCVGFLGGFVVGVKAAHISIPADELEDLSHQLQTRSLKMCMDWNDDLLSRVKTCNTMKNATVKECRAAWSKKDLCK